MLKYNLNWISNSMTTKNPFYKAWREPPKPKSDYEQRAERIKKSETLQGALDKVKEVPKR